MARARVARRKGGIARTARPYGGPGGTAESAIVKTEQSPKLQRTSRFQIPKGARRRAAGLASPKLCPAAGGFGL